MYTTPNWVKPTICIKLTVFIIIFAFIPIVNAQAQCPDGRLINEVYGYERDTVTYGSNVTVLGDPQTLQMDVYHPVNDTFQKRPVIIWAFGGAFVSGERNDVVMTRLCEIYAGKGYVAATMDYRLFPDEILGNPDSLELIDANVKAVHDMKAAIRFFRQSAAEGNPFRVDQEFIVVGGYSAGAFTALHLTYLNENDELSPAFETIIELNGGFEGNTGDSVNRSYASDVNAAVGFAGAVFDTNYIDRNEPPLFCLHGTADQTVPIGIGRSVGVVTTMGSSLMAERAMNQEVPLVFTPVPNANHLSIWFSLVSLNNFMIATDNALHDMYCSQTTSVDRPEVVKEISVYPNPASGWINIQTEFDGSVQNPPFSILDMQGRTVMTGKLTGPNMTIDVSSLQAGMYVLQVRGGVKKFVVGD